MLGITEKALAAGMNVIRYNQRNCGGTDALAPCSITQDCQMTSRPSPARSSPTMASSVWRWLASPWRQHRAQTRRRVGIASPAAVSCRRRVLSGARSLRFVRRAARAWQPHLRNLFLVAASPPLAAESPPLSGHFDPTRADGVRSLREFDDKVTAHYCGFTEWTITTIALQPRTQSGKSPCPRSCCTPPTTHLCASRRRQERRLPRTRTSTSSRPPMAATAPLSEPATAAMAAGTMAIGRSEIVNFLRQF